MTPEQIREHLLATGWEERREGVFHSEMSISAPWGTVTRPVRVQFNTNTLRVDVHSSFGSNWIRVAGCNYEAVVRELDGRLRVISFHLPASKR